MAHPIHPDYGPCDAIGPENSCAECVRIFNQLKKDIEELQTYIDELEDQEI